MNDSISTQTQMLCWLSQSSAFMDSTVSNVRIIVNEMCGPFECAVKCELCTLSVKMIPRPNDWNECVCLTPDWLSVVRLIQIHLVLNWINLMTNQVAETFTSRSNTSLETISFPSHSRALGLSITVDKLVLFWVPFNCIMWISLILWGFVYFCFFILFCIYQMVNLFKIGVMWRLCASTRWEISDFSGHYLTFFTTIDHSIHLYLLFNNTYDIGSMLLV